VKVRHEGTGRIDCQGLVDHPDDVQVKSIDGAQATILELRVHKDDLGKVIGRQGRTAKAVRTLLGAAGMKVHKRFTLEILEDERGAAALGDAGAHFAPRGNKGEVAVELLTIFPNV